MKELRVMDMIVKWHKNKYLKSLDDFWKVRTLFSYTDIEKFLNSVGEISDETVENLFIQAKFEFYTDSERKMLFSYISPLFKSRFGELIPVKPIDALKEYGIDKLEDSNEKGYTKIKN